MKRINKNRLQKKFNSLKRTIQRGSGNLYVIAILGTIVAGSTLMVGGVVPELNPPDDDAQVVEIDTNIKKSNKNTALELRSFGILSPSPTPTLTPTLTPGPLTPTRTPTPQVCLDKIALTLVLDVSTSMRSGDNIGKLNTAMDSLVDTFKDNTVVGAVEFAGKASFPGGGTRLEGSANLFGYQTYKSNKVGIRDGLTGLEVRTSSANDGTYMRNAFNRTIDKINASRQRYLDEGYRFVTIVFTDGVPETQFTDGNCVVRFDDPNYLCFARVQDPRTDLTNTLKSLSTVYAVGLYARDREAQAIGEATDLLQDASTIRSTARIVTNPDSLASSFENIMNSVCN